MRKGTALYIGNGCLDQNLFSNYLISMGFDLHKTSSISVAKQKLSRHRYTLLLIQLECVRKRIFYFYSLARYKNQDAIILVLMAKPQPIIEMRLFDCGVDDVIISKQMNPSALRSRIERRLYNIRPAPSIIGKQSLETDDIEIRSNKIMLKGGAIVDLYRREIKLNGFSNKIVGVSNKLLQYFLNNRDRAISREELIKSYIWDNSVCLPDKMEGGKAVDMAVTRLRKLIEPDPSNPQIILTVYGTGWILAKDAVISTPKMFGN